MGAGQGSRLLGRGWALERISGWLRSTEPALVVTGSPGAGKSALVSARVPAAARYLCQSQVTASSDPVRAFADIAGQLARTVPGYIVREGLYQATKPDGDGRRAMQAVLDCSSPAEAYDKALRFPLAALASAGRSDHVLVVIDGLDEAEYGDGSNQLVDLLAQGLARTAPTPCLRLLLTTRPGPAADRLRGLPAFDLTEGAPPRIDSVREHLDAVCAVPARQRRAIAAAAGGSHLYVEVARRLAAAGRGAILTGEPPLGLDALYDLALADVGAPDSLGRRVLALLARVRDRGLTTPQIAAVLGEPRERVEAALSGGRHLLAGTRWLRVHHRCLAERITVAHTAEPGAADWLIADALRRTPGRAPKARAASYAARNLLAHLADACDQSAAAAEAIAEDLSDPQFLTTALAAVGVDDVLSTLAYVNRARRSPVDEAVAAETVLRGQRRALRLARRSGDSALVAQQLVFEAATVGETPLARRLAAHVGRSGILTLWATNDSPFRFLPKATRGHANQVNQVAITADGTGAITASDGATRVWRLASGRVARTMPTTSKITALYQAPGTPHVVAATSDGQAEVLDTERGESVQQLSGSKTAMVTAFAVSAGGTRAVSGDMDGGVTVWDLTTGEPHRRLPGRAGLVTAVAITPDGGTVAAGLYGGGVIVWDLATSERRAQLTRTAAVTALALTPAADRLLVGGRDGLTIYALVEDRPAAPVRQLIVSRGVTAVAVNPAMPAYALLGTAFGQVAYVQMPANAV